MFSAASVSRLASKKGVSSLLSSTTSSLLKSTTNTPSKLSALAAQSRSFISRPDPEILRAGLNVLQSNWKGIVGGLVLGTGAVHTMYGNEDNFYDKRFILECDPDDLADFYGSENFMDLYCILPFMGTLMMRGSYFDDDGTVHSQGLPFGELLVSMVFSDSDEDGDGTEPGKWFNKRERFKNECFSGSFTMWDMVTNFGFEALADGRVMVYHHGEYFYGNLPPLSLIMSAIFRFHSHIVIKTTEHHLRYYAFRNDTEFDEHAEHESRDAMPIFWIKNYNPLKVISYLVFGTELDMPEHMKKKRAEAMVKFKAENPDEDEDEEEEEDEVKQEAGGDSEEQEEEEEEREVIAATLARKKTIADAALSKTHTLPVQRPEIMRRITLDIAMDKRHAREALAETTDSSSDEDKDDDDLVMDAILASKAADVTPITAAKKRATLRRIATSQALKRFQTKFSGENTELPKTTMKRSDTKAFEALKNADAEGVTDMQAAAVAARVKLAARRATKMSRRATSLIRPNSVEHAINFDIKKDSEIAM